jgi:hypothetical protein
MDMPITAIKILVNSVQKSMKGIKTCSATIRTITPIETLQNWQVHRKRKMLGNSFDDHVHAAQNSK